MISKELLGRYQYTCYEENSNKFWHIIFDMSAQTYICSYGRIGTRGHEPIYYTEQQARTKIKDKIKKGYMKITNKAYDEIIGSQAIDYINRLCDGE